MRIEPKSPNLPPLPAAAQAHPALLLLHALLHRAAADHVRPGLGGVLRAGAHVAPQRAAGARLVPFRRPVPAVREHHVRDQVQRHGLGPVPAPRRLRVGGHREVRPPVRASGEDNAHQAAGGGGWDGGGGEEEEEEVRSDVQEGAGAAAPDGRRPDVVGPQTGRHVN
jgi:hypothetical protein